MNGKAETMTHNLVRRTVPNSTDFFVPLNKKKQFAWNVRYPEYLRRIAPENVSLFLETLFTENKSDSSMVSKLHCIFYIITCV